jgi:hypothetical protein
MVDAPLATERVTLLYVMFKRKLATEAGKHLHKKGLRMSKMLNKVRR